MTLLLSPLLATRLTLLQQALFQRTCICSSLQQARQSSSSSKSRWKQRQSSDPYAREARVQQLKSRAAFKLLEMDEKWKLFKRNQTVVDLGYAPGSWSQVARERTKPFGRVVGIDLIPATPPAGVATFQGDFLSPVIQKLVKDFIIQSQAHPPPKRPAGADSGTPGDEDIVDQPSYIDRERQSSSHEISELDTVVNQPTYTVDVVLSDMSAPWEQVSGFSSNTLSNPYRRLMNTSGNNFRDHACSMDLCAAALQFASDTLKPGGHFICKFYQGGEDKALELKLKGLFNKVHRERPDSSRSESKEAYFVALKRKAGVTMEEVSGNTQSPSS